MFFLRRPSETRIPEILEAHSRMNFSYPELGATAAALPDGYQVDHERCSLGQGEETFARAKFAISSWVMFRNGWTQICWPDSPIERSVTVAVLFRAFGLYSLNLCRIVYVIDEPRRFGFAYGTLPAHAEAGEERFLVEWLEDDSVWYDVSAFSRPRHPLAVVAYPFARHLQSRFRRDSTRAMQEAT